MVARATSGKDKCDEIGRRLEELEGSDGLTARIEEKCAHVLKKSGVGDRAYIDDKYDEILTESRATAARMVHIDSKCDEVLPESACTRALASKLCERLHALEGPHGLTARIEHKCAEVLRQSGGVDRVHIDDKYDELFNESRATAARMAHAESKFEEGLREIQRTVKILEKS